MAPWEAIRAAVQRERTYPAVQWPTRWLRGEAERMDPAREREARAVMRRPKSGTHTGAESAIAEGVIAH